MKVLIGCEESGVVRRAFRDLGHDAWSCDLLPARDNSPFHYTGDVLEVIDTEHWELGIFHPPCTYLCSMGIWWNHKRPERKELTEKAVQFFMLLANCTIPRVAIENPIGTMSTRWRKPDQIIQPWMFGHEANKPTCLWLKNLPELKPIKIVDKGRFYVKSNGSRMSAWSHTTSGTRKELRARIASTTFNGVGKAMAEQWGGLDMDHRNTVS